MKKRMALIFLTGMLLAGLMTGCGSSNRSSDETVTEDAKDPAGMVHLDSEADVSALFDEIYGGVDEDLLPYEVQLTELSMDEDDLISYHTGLADMNGIDSIYLSESMIGSTPYSAVYIKTTDDGNANEILQELMESINPAKWVCVTAEKQIGATFGGDIFFVMGYAETADAVFEGAKAAAESRDMTVANTTEKNNPI
ncbi:MAG: hypothetical protein NC337_01325 [Roseburia sp.]|nr:hypothetical protein [Roseburia sp.]